MFILHKTRRCNEARLLLASPQTSFRIPDERTPKNVCRVKKNSDDDSRTRRWLWWSLLHWWSKTLLFSWVLYSSRRSHSNFLNIQLCRFEKLWRPNLFWTFRLEILIGWGEAETENDCSYFICLFCVCLFVFTSEAWKMFSVICIFLIKNQWFEWKHITLFYQVVMDRVVWGPTYSFFAVLSRQRAMEHINVATS